MFYKNQRFTVTIDPMKDKAELWKNGGVYQLEKYLGSIVTVKR